MDDLFSDSSLPDTTPTVAKDEARFDWINLFAHEKLGAPEGWRWFAWTRENYDTPQEFLLVTGAICTAKHEKGKHKGQDNWKLRDKKTEAKHAIRRSELEAFQREWSARTGLCFECYGTGQEWSGWSAKEGNSYRPCHLCDATGRSKSVAA